MPQLGAKLPAETLRRFWIMLAPADLKPERSFIVYAGEERHPKAERIDVIGVAELAALLASGLGPCLAHPHPKISTT